MLKESDFMKINKKGDWECQLCGASSLMYGLHFAQCPIVKKNNKPKAKNEQTEDIPF